MSELPAFSPDVRAALELLRTYRWIGRNLEPVAFEQHQPRHSDHLPEQSGYHNPDPAPVACEPDPTARELVAPILKPSKDQYRIVTRPDDWAPPARAILEARAAWGRTRA